MRRIFGMVLLAIVAANAAATENYQEWWWNPSLDGMGFNIGQQGDTVAVAWYFYDGTGEPTYLVLAGPLVDGVVEGTLWRSAGPPPGPGYDPDDVTRTDVGDAILTFESGNEATFDYDYDGGSGSISIQRFTFGSMDVSGSWDFAASGVTSECSVAVNGPFSLSGVLTIDQVDNAIDISQNLINGDTCTYDATGSQKGSYIDAAGTFSCSWGFSGAVALQGMRVVDDFLTLRMHVQTTEGETCVAESGYAAVKSAEPGTPPDPGTPEYSSCIIEGVCVQLSLSNCTASGGLYVGNVPCF